MNKVIRTKLLNIKPSWKPLHFSTKIPVFTKREFTMHQQNISLVLAYPAVPFSKQLQILELKPTSRKLLRKIQVDISCIWCQRGERRGKLMFAKWKRADFNLI